MAVERMNDEEQRELRKTFSIYVLEGPDEGWHEFPTVEELRAYCSLLIQRNYDFVIEPRW